MKKEALVGRNLEPTNCYEDLGSNSQRHEDNTFNGLDCQVSAI
jgi:hypothetical protein